MSVFRVDGLAVAVAAVLGLANADDARQAAGDHRPSALARKPKPMRGTKHVKNFTVPRGQTVLVTGTLRIFAKKDIAIVGKLLVRDAAGLQLRSGHRLRIARGAAIRPAPQPKLRRPSSQAHSSAGTAEPIWKLNAHIIDVDGVIDADPGQNVLLSVSAHGFIIVAGEISTANGLSADTPLEDGHPSGSIVMNGEVFGDAEYIDLKKGSVLQTGDGGRGFDTMTGELIGVENPCSDAHTGQLGRQTLKLQGTDGGNAGSIRLLTRRIDNDRARIILGDGGEGGNAGFVGFAPDARSKAPNGSPGHGGADVVAFSGKGGRGGSY